MYHILSLNFELSYFICASILLLLMIPFIFYFDIKFMIIPNSLLIAAAISALIIMLATQDYYLTHITGAIVPLIFFTPILLFRRNGIGFGDIKLTVVTGLITGPLIFIWGMAISCTAAMIFIMIRLATGKKIKEFRFPFGPFIITGSLLVWLTVFMIK